MHFRVKTVSLKCKKTKSQHTHLILDSRGKIKHKTSLFIHHIRDSNNICSTMFLLNLWKLLTLLVRLISGKQYDTLLVQFRYRLQFLVFLCSVVINSSYLTSARQIMDINITKLNRMKSKPSDPRKIHRNTENLVDWFMIIQDLQHHLLKIHI